MGGLFVNVEINFGPFRKRLCHVRPSAESSCLDGTITSSSLTLGRISTNIGIQVIIHDCGAKLLRTLGESRDEAFDQRQFHRHHAHGPRFCSPRIASRLSAWRSIHLRESGRQREPLEGAAARRHLRRLEAPRARDRFERRSGVAVADSQSAVRQNCIPRLLFAALTGVCYSPHFEPRTRRTQLNAP